MFSKELKGRFSPNVDPTISGARPWPLQSRVSFSENLRTNVWRISLRRGLFEARMRRLLANFLIAGVCRACERMCWLPMMLADEFTNTSDKSNNTC